MLPGDGRSTTIRYDRAKVNYGRGSEMEITTNDDQIIITLQKQGYTRNQAEDLLALSHNLANLAIGSSNLIKKLIQKVIH